MQSREGISVRCILLLEPVGTMATGSVGPDRVAPAEGFTATAADGAVDIWDLEDAAIEPVSVPTMLMR